MASNISYYERKLAEYKTWPVQTELFQLCVSRLEININRYKQNSSETIKAVLDSLCNLLNMFDNVQIAAYY